MKFYIAVFWIKCIDKNSTLVTIEKKTGTLHEGVCKFVEIYCRLQDN
jgi:hypothetical protein